MNVLTLALMALALSMDALAVAVARGMSARRRRGADCLATALTFGAAQGMMPVVGYYGGRQLANEAIQAGGELLAALILALLGVKMLTEAVRGDEPAVDHRRAARSYLRCLLAQGVATSIDALAVGVGLCGVCEGIWGPALVIGAVTATVCAAGFRLGGTLGAGDCRRAQTTGGAILILLALRMLLM